MEDWIEMLLRVSGARGEKTFEGSHVHPLRPGPQNLACVPWDKDRGCAAAATGIDDGDD